MSKRVRRVRRRREPRLLDRILATPNLVQVIPQLQPEVLHRVIQHCGLEDCGELLALATPGQLARVFDLDLWRPAAPGLDEHFDADRFGRWLEVMVDAGVSGAAATLAAIDVDLVVAGLVQHVRVFDYAAAAPYLTLDGEQASPVLGSDDRLRSEIGGFIVSATRTEFWDTMTAVLNALADAHGDAFVQIMRGCCRLSNSRPEADGFHDLLTTNEQAMFDLGVDREARRDTRGYVTSAEARAFLQVSRQIDIRQAATSARDPITHAYFRGVEPAEPVTNVPADAASVIVDLLHDAGVMPRAPRALLEGAQREPSAPSLARIRAHLQFVHERDPDAYAARNAELAYLANVIAAGATIQSRTVVAEEASNAAIAVCNLGLENWPVAVSEDHLVRHDLVRVFQVGWTVLHEDVCMYAADTLLNVLHSLHCADPDVQGELGTLRTRLTKYWRAGSPWHAREALDVIAILDTPSWAALLGFIDQLPTLHAAVGASLAGTTGRIDASAFEFIAENSQIQRMRDFMEMLPRRLTS
jgi:hypothetical protein